uniref:Uncharacterized protein n=1 Tax=Fagus sylvatica TaxID=28930 RepID=A0A2N9EU80_FAGSY
MAFNAMDHLIHFLCYCLLEWELGSKFVVAQNISSCCCSSMMLDCHKIL